MKKNSKNAFTLVELLAVIVILAIILVIAVPKVMSIINDAKKATLESTAKMIASSAEKAKVQNTVLGNIDSITCESVTKQNDIDYEDCSIEFEGNTAKVTIKGKGKFKGLNVCDATKITALAENKKCGVLASKYIKKLLENEETLHNGLVQTYATIDGEQVDAGIRYAGPLAGDNAVKNQVYFNCKDTDGRNEYGSKNYNYASSCEVWRIIGLFDTKISESDTIGSKRIKIVRDEFLGTVMSWDSCSKNVETEKNNGFGINQWGEIKDSNGNIIYEGADLMRMLNGYYIGESNTCRYCNEQNQTTCRNDCLDNIIPLSSQTVDMIEEVVWNLGTATYSNRISLSTMYAGEISAQTGKICIPNDSYCSDTVSRTSTWLGKVGLIYPSDYAYASTNDECLVDLYGSDSKCDIDNWLHPDDGNYWTISPYAYTGSAYGIWLVDSSQRIIHNDAFGAKGVRPSVYLSSNVQIIGGDGNDVPYMLSM